MAPPHVRPISHASSSPSCISSRRGVAAARTAAACSMTRASTQPPMVTEPKTLPSSPTNIFAPSLRGVVPRVRTRVAMAARFSARCSRSISSKVSCDIGVPLRIALERPLTVLAAEVETPAVVLRDMLCIRDGYSHLTDWINGRRSPGRLFGLRRGGAPAFLHELGLPLLLRVDVDEHPA